MTDSKDASVPEKKTALTIWIDADAAPQTVKEIVFRASARLNLPVWLVANQNIYVPPTQPHIQSVVVASGADMADRYIVKNAVPGDLVITADIPLAAQLVEQSVWVVDPRGLVLDESNVRSRLATRDFMDAARGAGMLISGPAPYSAKDKGAFASAFDRTLTKAMRRRA